MMKNRVFSRRLTRNLGLLTTATLCATLLVAQNTHLTDASWTDAEWDHSASGTVNCAAASGAFASRGEGRALSGRVAGFNLDQIVEASGVRATHSSTASHVSPGGTSPAAPGPDAYADSLSVSALQIANIGLTGVLQLPLNTPTGALGQYGKASSNGQASGASGYVTSSGAINLDGSPGGYPNLAQLKLSTLLSSLNYDLGALLPSITDVSLTTGAVAGRASLDGCADAWSPLAGAGLDRSYLASTLRLDASSPTVGALVSAASTNVNNLESTVNGITNNNSVKTGLINGTTSLLNGVLSGPNGSGLLRLGTVNVSSLSASVNLDAVRTLLTTSFSDSGHVLTIDPTTGTVTIDTVALLQKAYPAQYGSGLNGLAPNTNILADPSIANTLTAALTSALGDWIGHVNTAITAAINAISVNTSITINLEVFSALAWIPIGTITLSTTGTLSSLTTTTQLNLLPGLPGPVSALISGTLSPVLTLLRNTLTTNLGSTVFTAVNGALDGLRALPSATAALTAPIVNAVSNLYNQLFLSGIVAVTINAQNDPLAGSPEPPDLASLPSGRYDVSAIRIGVLDALGSNSTRLYLGRGSVGPVCSKARVAAGGCSGY